LAGLDFQRTLIDQRLRGLLLRKEDLGRFERIGVALPAVGFAAGLSGLLIGYAVSKNRKSKGARFVNGLAFFPYLMPSLALSVTFYLMGLNLGMAGAWIVVAIILGTVKYIPMASRSSSMR
jgi:ABC-type Fe3+ transport system permease subunit